MNRNIVFPPFLWKVVIFATNFHWCYEHVLSKVRCLLERVNLFYRRVICPIPSHFRFKAICSFSFLKLESFCLFVYWLGLNQYVEMVETSQPCLLLLHKMSLIIFKIYLHILMNKSTPVLTHNLLIVQLQAAISL